MTPHLLVSFFQKGSSLIPLKVPKGINKNNINAVSRPPSVAGNNTTATMGKQRITKAQTKPIPSTP